MLPSHLTLHEKLALLNIDANEHKTIHKSYDANYLHALGGLLIIDMLLANHIKWHNKTQIVAEKNNPPTNPLMLLVWELCSTPNKINWFWWGGKRQETAQTLQDWLKVAVNKTNTLPSQVEKNLLAKQQLQLKKEHIMGIFPHTYHVLVDTKDQIAYKNYLKQLVRIGLGTFTPQDYILLKIIKNCKLQDIITVGEPKKTQKQFGDKLEVFTLQAIEHDAIINFLASLQMEKNIEDFVEVLDSLVDIVDSIADATGDARDGGGDGGGD
jgi:hypothetical protein